MDDLSIPQETVIYYARKRKIIETSILIIGLIAGIYYAIFPVHSDERWNGVILAALAGGFLYLNGNMANNKEPQIILNDKGIQTSTCDFKSWEEITNVKIDLYSKMGNFLLYDYTDGDEKFFIGNLDTDEKQLKYLIKIYQYRYNVRQKNP